MSAEPRPEHQWRPPNHAPHHLQVPNPANELLDVFGLWGQIHLHGDPKGDAQMWNPGAPQRSTAEGGSAWRCGWSAPWRLGGRPACPKSPCNLTAHASPSTGLTCLPFPFPAPSHPEGRHAPMCMVSPALTSNPQRSRTVLPGTQKCCAQRQGVRPRRTDSWRDRRPETVCRWTWGHLPREFWDPREPRKDLEVGVAQAPRGHGCLAPQTVSIVGRGTATQSHSQARPGTPRA